ncbi:MAG: histidine kinase [Bacteroidota bacterium]
MGKNKSMIWKSAIWLALYLLWGPVPGKAQVPYVQFTPTDGFPAHSVYNIVQDQAGYLWLGTNLGLFKYCGHNSFKLYENEDLKGLVVYGLSADHAGRLWFNTYQGKVGYVENDSLHTLNEGPLKGSKVHDFIIDQQTGNIYFYVGNHLYGYDPVKKTFDHYFDCSMCPVEMERKLYEFLVVCDAQFFLLATSVEIKQVKTGIKVNRLPFSHHQFKFLKSTYDLKHLWIYDRATERCAVVQYPNLNIISAGELGIPECRDIQTIYEDSLGFTWINTGDGTWPLTPDLQPFGNGQPLLPGHRVNHVFQDAEGSYWAATTMDGVFYFNSLHSKQLLEKKISSIHRGSNGKFIVVTHFGELFLYENQQIVRVFQTDKSLIVRSILEFDGQLVVSFLSGSTPKIFEINSGRERSTQFNFVNGEKGPSDEIYYSDYHFSYRLSSNDFTNVLEAYAARKPRRSVLFTMGVEQIEANRSRTFFIDRFDPKVWMTDINYLRYYDTETGEIVPIDLGTSQKKSIAQTSDSSIWVASSNGLFKIRDDRVCQHLTTENGLISNICNELLVDEEDQLWVVTGNGLSKIDTRSGAGEGGGQVHVKGLFREGVNAFHKVDSTLYIGTDLGLFAMDESALSDNTFPPPIYITSLKIWDRDTVLASQYKLPLKDNNLTVRFEGLAYRSRGDFQYKYRMLGIDSAWTYTPGHINFVRYRQLAPGEYKFQVKAVNEDWVESLQPATLTFWITPPYWQTPWFLSLAMIGLVAMTIFGTTRWQKRKHRVHLLESRIKELRMEALRSQMNPHFIFNTLNAIQLTLYKQDRKESMNYLVLFSDMMRCIFDYSQRSKISLEEEIQFLNKYLKLEKLRFGDQVQVLMEIDDELDTHRTYLPPLILQPIIENAFKHGLMHKHGRGKLELAFSKMDQLIKIVVRDDGIGRKKAFQIMDKRWKGRHRSSTNNINERIQLINNNWKRQGKHLSLKTIDLFDRFGHPTGTQVELVIKL